MNEEQSSAWQLAWRPKNEALFRENLEGEALLRWKFQRFAKNYLRCIKGIDESIGRLSQRLSLPESKECLIVYTANHGRFLGSTDGSEPIGYMKNRREFPLFYPGTPGLIPPQKS